MNELREWQISYLLKDTSKWTVNASSYSVFIPELNIVMEENEVQSLISDSKNDAMINLKKTIEDYQINLKEKLCDPTGGVVNCCFSKIQYLNECMEKMKVPKKTIASYKKIVDNGIPLNYVLALNHQKNNELQDFLKNQFRRAVGAQVVLNKCDQLYHVVTKLINYIDGRFPVFNPASYQNLSCQGSLLYMEVPQPKDTFTVLSNIVEKLYNVASVDIPHLIMCPYDSYKEKLSRFSHDPITNQPWFVVLPESLSNDGLTILQGAIESRRDSICVITSLQHSVLKVDSKYVTKLDRSKVESLEKNLEKRGIFNPCLKINFKEPDENMITKMIYDNQKVYYIDKTYSQLPADVNNSIFVLSPDALQNDYRIFCDLWLLNKYEHVMYPDGTLVKKTGKNLNIEIIVPKSSIDGEEKISSVNQNDNVNRYIKYEDSLKLLFKSTENNGELLKKLSVFRKMSSSILKLIKGDNFKYKILAYRTALHCCRLEPKLGSYIIAVPSNMFCGKIGSNGFIVLYLPRSTNEWDGSLYEMNSDTDFINKIKDENKTKVINLLEMNDQENFLEIIQFLCGCKKESIEEVFKKYKMTETICVRLVISLIRIAVSQSTINVGSAGIGKTAQANLISSLFKCSEFNDSWCFYRINCHGGLDMQLLRKEMRNLRDILNDSSNYKKNLLIYFEELNTSLHLPFLASMILSLQEKKTGILVNKSDGKGKITFFSSINPHKKISQATKIISTVGIEQVILKTESTINLLKDTKEPIYISKNNSDYAYNVLSLPKCLESLVTDASPQMISTDENENFTNEEKKSVKEIINGIIKETTYIDDILKGQTDSLISIVTDVFEAKACLIPEKALLSYRNIIRFIYFLNSTISILPDKKWTFGDMILFSLYFNFVLSFSNCVIRPEGGGSKEFDEFLKKNGIEADGKIIRLQDEMTKKIMNIAKNKYSEIFGNYENIEEIIKKMMDMSNDIISDVVIDPGYIKLPSLIYHVAALYVSYNALKMNGVMIPVLLIGKPGTSKTMSCQLFIDFLEKKYNEDEKTWNKFVGRMFLTSVYTNNECLSSISQELALAQLNNHVLNLLTIDEIGFAEKNPNKSTKRLHHDFDQGVLVYNGSTFEYVKVFTAATSNYRIDIAILSRMLFICSNTPSNLLYTFETILVSSRISDERKQLIIHFMADVIEEGVKKNPGDLPMRPIHNIFHILKNNQSIEKIYPALASLNINPINAEFLDKDEYEEIRSIIRPDSSIVILASCIKDDKSQGIMINCDGMKPADAITAIIEDVSNSNTPNIRHLYETELQMTPTELCEKQMKLLINDFDTRIETYYIIHGLAPLMDSIIDILNRQRPDTAALKANYTYSSYYNISGYPRKISFQDVQHIKFIFIFDYRQLDQTHPNCVPLPLLDRLLRFNLSTKNFLNLSNNSESFKKISSTLKEYSMIRRSDDVDIEVLSDPEKIGELGLLVKKNEVKVAAKELFEKVVELKGNPYVNDVKDLIIKSFEKNIANLKASDPIDQESLDEFIISSLHILGNLKVSDMYIIYKYYTRDISLIKPRPKDNSPLFNEEGQEDLDLLKFASENGALEYNERGVVQFPSVGYNYESFKELLQKMVNKGVRHVTVVTRSQNVSHVIPYIVGQDGKQYDISVHQASLAVSASDFIDWYYNTKDILVIYMQGYNHDTYGHIINQFQYINDQRKVVVAIGVQDNLIPDQLTRFRNHPVVWVNDITERPLSKLRRSLLTRYSIKAVMGNGNKLKLVPTDEIYKYVALHYISISIPMSENKENVRGEQQANGFLTIINDAVGNDLVDAECGKVHAENIIVKMVVDLIKVLIKNKIDENFKKLFDLDNIDMDFLDTTNPAEFVANLDSENGNFGMKTKKKIWEIVTIVLNNFDHLQKINDNEEELKKFFGVLREIFEVTKKDQNYWYYLTSLVYENSDNVFQDVQKAIDTLNTEKPYLPISVFEEICKKINSYKNELISTNSFVGRRGKAIAPELTGDKLEKSWFKKSLTYVSEEDDEMDAKIIMTKLYEGFEFKEDIVRNGIVGSNLCTLSNAVCDFDPNIVQKLKTLLKDNEILPMTFDEFKESYKNEWSDSKFNFEVDITSDDYQYPNITILDELDIVEAPDTDNIGIDISSLLVKANKEVLDWYTQKELPLVAATYNFLKTKKESEKKVLVQLFNIYEGKEEPFRYYIERLHKSLGDECTVEKLEEAIINFIDDNVFILYVYPSEITKENADVYIRKQFTKVKITFSRIFVRTCLRNVDGFDRQRLRPFLENFHRASELSWITDALNAMDFEIQNTKYSVPRIFNDFRKNPLPRITWLKDPASHKLINDLFCEAGSDQIALDFLLQKAQEIVQIQNSLSNQSNVLPLRLATESSVPANLTYANLLLPAVLARSDIDACAMEIFSRVVYLSEKVSAISVCDADFFFQEDLEGFLDYLKMTSKKKQ